MKKKILLFAILIGLALTACRDQSGSPTALPTLQDTVTHTPIPTEAALDTPTHPVEPTNTTRPTETNTLTPTSTATATTTPTPSVTPTNTPSPTPAYNLPGYYSAGGCKSYDLPKHQYSVDFCILNVVIQYDGHMVFTVNWTVHIPNKQSIRKRSDSGNRKMYLMDNLGNRYDHVNTGDDAAKVVYMNDGDTATGWFEFPAAQKGATSFTFYDGNQDVSLGPFTFVAPIILTEQLNLNWYPLTLEYKKALWESATPDNSGVVLEHLEISNCQLLEWEPSEVQGKYKNTIELGGINFEIYGYLEPEWGVREYLLLDPIDGQDLDPNPLFHAIIPYNESLQCIFDLSEILATLKLAE